MSVHEIEARRFNALAGFTRDPRLIAVVQEFAWFETDDGRVLGVQTWDRIDRDFGWIVLGRDERGQFRAVDVQASLPSAEAAKADLLAALARWQAGPDVDMHQGAEGEGGRDRTRRRFLHPNHVGGRAASLLPCAGIGSALLASARDDRRDDALSSGCGRQLCPAVPDHCFRRAFVGAISVRRLHRAGLRRDWRGRGGRLRSNQPARRPWGGGTTANPPQGEAEVPPLTPETFGDYLGEYVPIKLARALKKKLRKARPYWTEPGMADTPFALAIQDFHAPAAMTRIVPAATELAFGVRHSIRDGHRHIEWIERHAYGAATEPSGFFFRYPGAENVSALLINPQGTLVKFNRLGYLAGFGDRRVRMVRKGIRRCDGDADRRPRNFVDRVHTEGYVETWVEGMVVLHNPTARIPLDPKLLPGATHEFLEQDGRIMSLLPPEPPTYTSRTWVYLEGEDPATADARED